LEHVPLGSAPRTLASRPLVRRIFAAPSPIAPGSRLQVSNAKLQTTQTLGPYILSGGWWNGGVHRDYYFVQAPNGELWWLYYDHRRQCFFLQGQVE
jgi:hypothetical protein